MSKDNINYFKIGYNAYPNTENLTDALQSCITNSGYMEAYEEYMSGYQKAAADDTRLYNNNYEPEASP